MLQRYSIISRYLVRFSCDISLVKYVEIEAAFPTLAEVPIQRNMYGFRILPATYTLIVDVYRYELNIYFIFSGDLWNFLCWRIVELNTFWRLLLFQKI